MAGKVESTGKDVKRFKAGDPVFGSTGMRLGAHAEYVCIPEDGMVAEKPANISFDEAAAVVFGGNTAWHFFKKGNIENAKKVLIYGASGAIGTYAVQLSKHFGAEVTAVCSAPNTELVKSLGADEVVDYTKEDFTKRSEKWDIIFDTVGKSPFSGSIRSLNKDGYYLRAVHMSPAPVIKGIWASITSNKKVIGGIASEHQEDLLFLKDLLEKGIIKPVIDKSYPMEQIAEAHRHVDRGHKKGNVVVTIGNEE